MSLTPRDLVRCLDPERHLPADRTARRALVGAVLGLALLPILAGTPTGAQASDARRDGPLGRQATHASTTLVINEVDYQSAEGLEDGDFVELQNVGEKPVGLQSYDLVGITSTSPQREYRRYHLPAVVLGAGAYFVVCGSTSLVPNCDFVVAPATNTWRDRNADQTYRANAIALVQNATGNVADDVLVDSVSYDGTTPGGPAKGGTWTEGKGINPGDSLLDAYFGIARIPDGTDTDENSDDFGVHCVTPGIKNSGAARGLNGCQPPARSGQIVVNEADYTQPGAEDDAEFVELKNVSGHTIELGPWWQVLGVDDSGAVYRRIALPRRALLDDHYYVLCGDQAKVVNCDQVISPTVGAWTDSKIRSSPFGAIAVVKNATGKGAEDILVDSVSYDGLVKDGPPAGGSWTEEAPVGPGDSTSLARLGISRLPDGQDSQNNDKDFSGRCISPGYGNLLTTGGFAPCGTAATVTPTPSATDSPTANVPPTQTPPIDPLPPTDPPTRGATDEPTKTPAATDTPAPTRTQNQTSEPTEAPTGTAAPPVLEFAVDSPGNEADEIPGDRYCKTSAGTCTLRAALTEANRITDASASYVIYFKAPMTVLVPAADPLPAVRRGNGRIVGRLVPSLLTAPAGAEDAADASGSSDDDRLKADKSAADQQDVVIQGPGDGDLIGLELNKVSTVTVQGLKFTGFRLGIAITNASARNLIGSDGDGKNDLTEGNALTANLQDGLAIDRSSTDNIVRLNQIDRNNWHGIRLAQTRMGGNRLDRNLITRNGGAAIGVDPQGAELPPPIIDTVDWGAGTVTGHVDPKSCSPCLIQLFADPVDEARFFVNLVLARADGIWQVTGLDPSVVTEVSLTATATDRGSNTSRLGPMRAFANSGPQAAAWRLLEVAQSQPRVLGAGRQLMRIYRLVDGTGAGVPNADVNWSPLDFTFKTDANGYVICIVPIDTFASLAGTGLAMSVEAVTRDGGAHPVNWNPRMAIARARRVVPGGILLDLSNLGATGVGAKLRWLSRQTAGAMSKALEANRTGASTHVIPVGGHAEEAAADVPAQTESFGAAFLAAPVPEQQDPNQFSWQTNIARGGGVYQLQPSGETLAGILEIVAPIDAYNSGGKAVGCPSGPDGATVLRWRENAGCWVPAPGSQLNVPPADATTFSASVPVTLAPSVAVLGKGEPSPASGATLFEQSDDPILYTVGYDTEPPTLTLKVAANTALAILPAVLATSADRYSGVNAMDGVTATLGGVPISVMYDRQTFEIQIPTANRTLPAGKVGLQKLAVGVTDGLCNRSVATVMVRLEGTGPKPDAIYAPYTAKGVRLGNR